MSAESLLFVKNLKTWFPLRGGLLRRITGHVKAVDGVSFQVKKGEIVSIVGESGCGKSTLGYSILGLTRPTAGEIRLREQAIDIHRIGSWKPFRKDFQIVFQDPYTSLNPRLTVFEILSEPMVVHGLCKRSQARERTVELLETVELSADHLDRYPHAFSGGQRQRLGIARAVSLNPKLIVCDEVTAALDVSVQAQILHLLMDLKRKLGLSLVFISHDLAVVKAISDRIHVMYLGRIVESAPTDDLFAEPRHPYTRALLEAIPVLDTSGKKRPKVLAGEIPSPVDLPAGCYFAGRCSRAQEKCHSDYPDATFDGQHSWTCVNPC
ncbi:MAG: ABC transporter ATP-binding protein [Proteobacteria bacterium]|nr:ABC transporter ATP-binding protein [Pseudomonadota bacterium]